jgi:hypothetical protein
MDAEGTPTGMSVVEPRRELAVENCVGNSNRVAEGSYSLSKPTIKRFFTHVQNDK